MTEVREKVTLVFNEEKDTVAIDFNCPFYGQDPGSFFYRLKGELEKMGVKLDGPTPVEHMFSEMDSPIKPENDKEGGER